MAFLCICYSIQFIEITHRLNVKNLGKKKMKTTTKFKKKFKEHQIQYAQLLFLYHEI